MRLRPAQISVGSQVSVLPTYHDRLGLTPHVAAQIGVGEQVLGSLGAPNRVVAGGRA
jgi:hypothetical protein